MRPFVSATVISCILALLLFEGPFMRAQQQPVSASTNLLTGRHLQSGRKCKRGGSERRQRCN
jgi:hypothetical protein